MVRERPGLSERSEVPCCLSDYAESVLSKSGPVEICSDCPYFDDFSFINRLAGYSVYKIVSKNRTDKHRKIQPLFQEPEERP